MKQITETEDNFTDALPIGDREPIIVNISHESKSVRNSEAAFCNGCV